MSRKELEMTKDQLEAILDACKPVPLIMLHLGMPRSQQERANDAWEALGKELGFRHMTVDPAEKGDRFFTAEVSDANS